MIEFIEIEALKNQCLILKSTIIQTYFHQYNQMPKIFERINNQINKEIPSLI